MATTGRFVDKACAEARAVELEVRTSVQHFVVRCNGLGWQAGLTEWEVISDRRCRQIRPHTDSGLARRLTDCPHGGRSSSTSSSK
jgi:hypothetical protein